MAEEGGRTSRRLPERRATPFDVTGWLAGLSNCSPDEVQLLAESELDGLLTVTYQSTHEQISVRLRRVGGVTVAAWELTGELGDRIERVVVPGGTRFVWRRSRGTHA